MNYSSLTTKQLEKKKYSLINEANKIHQEISRRNRAQDQNKELENEIRRALKLYKLKPYIAAEHVFVNPTTEQYQKVVNISRKMKSETQEIERSKILFP